MINVVKDVFYKPLYEDDEVISIIVNHNVAQMRLGVVESITYLPTEAIIKVRNKDTKRCIVKRVKNSENGRADSILKYKWSDVPEEAMNGFTREERMKGRQSMLSLF